MRTPPQGRVHIFRAVFAAAALSFALETLLAAFLGGISVTAVLRNLAGYPFVVALAFAVGWWLGNRAWPRHGARLARMLLRRRIEKKHDFIFLSDRPDQNFGLARATWEVVGFSAGVSVFVTSVFLVLGVAGFGPARLLIALLPLITVWASFLLVPYWIFARLGLRVVDPMRWLVLPMSRRYADRLKLSNGALLLLGAGAAFQASFRAGESDVAALAATLVTIVRVVAFVLVIAATAVAYYARAQHPLAHRLELEAVEMGIRDGRGMSDGDFIPRLPPPRKA